MVPLWYIVWIVAAIVLMGLTLRYGPDPELPDERPLQVGHCPVCGEPFCEVETRRETRLRFFHDGGASRCVQRFESPAALQAVRTRVVPPDWMKDVGD